MYCQFCGAETNQAGVACLKCGKEVPRVSSNRQADVAGHLKQSSRDAVDVLKQLVDDPIDSPRATFVTLGQERALGAGLALCLMFALVGAVGVTIGARQLLANLFFLTREQPGLGMFFRFFFQLLVFPAALIGIAAALRVLLRTLRGSIHGDILIAGAAVVPLGLALLLGGILASASFQIVTLLILFALSFMVLVLYSGLTQLSGISSRAAALAAPTMMLAAVWLTQQMFGTLM